MAKQHKGNPVARAAILRKGGVHEKGKTAKRQHSKRQLNKMVSDYLKDPLHYDDSNCSGDTDPPNNPQAKTQKTATIVAVFFDYFPNLLGINKLFRSLSEVNLAHK